jgi:cytochrome c551/c552
MRKTVEMRKWLPFIVLLLVIVGMLGFMLVTGQTDDYIPLTSDPAIVYKEACAECHGEKGKGEGPLYADLADEYMEKEGVVEIVRNGDLFMPAFPNIPDSTLNRLAEYVANREFVE